MLSITVVLLVKRFLLNLITIDIPNPHHAITPTGYCCKKNPSHLIRNFFFRRLKFKLLKIYPILRIKLGIFENVKNVKLLFYCSFLLRVDMFFVLNYIFQICELGKRYALQFIDRCVTTFLYRQCFLSIYLKHQCFLSIYFKSKASFRISSNQRPWRVFHFKALKCGTYWRKALILE